MPSDEVYLDRPRKCCRPPLLVTPLGLQTRQSLKPKESFGRLQQNVDCFALGDSVSSSGRGLVIALVPFTVIDEASSFNAILGRT